MRFHTSLPVQSIPETTAFYRVLLQSEPVKTKEDYAKFLPPHLQLNISFHESPGAVLEGVHLGLELADQAEVDEAAARLEAAGVPLIRRETSVCCYANQDKFRVTDPSGYEWEIYTLLEDTEHKIDSGTTCCGGSESANAETPSTSACCA